MDPRSLRLYRHPLSGHCHRVELILSILDLAYQKIDVDFAAKPPELLAANRFGQLPVLIDGADAIADSAAILVYLASRYDSSRRWLPTEPRQAAEVTRWLSAASGPLAYGPSAARVTRLFQRPGSLEPMHAIAARLFGVVEEELATRRWLAADHATIADLAWYAYTARAPEGGISLAPYPNLRAWLARVEALPGFIPMVTSDVPSATT
ncbi:MAG: glutathione S-transferase [Kofleriaceae bacterium]